MKKLLLFIIASIVLAGVFFWFSAKKASFETIASSAGIKNTELDVTIEEVTEEAVAVPTETPTSVPIQASTVTPVPTGSIAPTVKKYSMKQFPFAVSVEFRNGDSFLEWYNQNSDAQKFVTSRLFQGVFDEVASTLRARSKELKISSVEDEFLSVLLADILRAHAVFHYDISRGENGGLFVYERNKSPLTAAMMPVLIASAGRMVYHADKLNVSVIEIALGTKKIYVAEQHGQVFLGSSLGVVLNGVSQDIEHTLKAEGSLVYTIRGEAFLKNLKKILINNDTWNISGGFNLSKDVAVPTGVFVDKAEIFERFSPTIAREVLHAIPADVFVAVGTSIALPQDITPEEWNSIALSEPLKRKIPVEPKGGLSLIWDIAPGGFGDIGIAVSGVKSPADLSTFLSSDLANDTCAAQAVYIAATSESLLGRMKESCNGQNRSVFNDLEANNIKEPSQLTFLVRPAEAMKGIIAQQIDRSHEEFVNQETAEREDVSWKAQYEKAVKAAQTSSDETLGSIPGILMTGNVSSSDGARLQAFFSK